VVGEQLAGERNKKHERDVDRRGGGEDFDRLGQQKVLLLD
jgi:hypothetical protein